MTMTLDRTFVNEIKKAANGDGSREYKFAFIKKLQEVSSALGHRYEFNDCIKKYGRAKVAICIAATIYQNQCEFERPEIAWALDVMSLWTNKTGERSISAATISIHPAILADNSYSLRKLTLAA